MPQLSLRRGRCEIEALTLYWGISAMSSMLRVLIVLIKVLAGLLAVAAAAVVALIAYSAIDRYSFSRRSPLAANLPADFQEASSVFKKRIIERFPAGSSADELVRVLSEQGFQRNPRYGDWRFEQGVSPTQFSGRLTLTPGPGLSPVCRLVWNVAWKPDSAGQIEAIYAEYHGVCL